MLRRYVLLLVLALVAPAAAATPEAPPVDAQDAVDADLPDVGGLLAGAAGATAQAAGAAGGAVAGAASSVASGFVAAVAAVAHAIAGAVTGAAKLAVAAVQITFFGLVDATLAVAHALGVAATLLGSALAWTGRLLVDALTGLATLTLTALSFVASAVAAAWSALADAALRGVDVAREHPRETAIATGSAGAGLGLWALLRRFGLLGALPLYSRLKTSELLDHPQRAAIHRFVKAHPGAHTTQIAEAQGLGWGTIVHHLNKLEDARLLTAKKSGNRKCYFVVGEGTSAPERAAIAALKHEKAAAIADFVGTHPGAAQKQIAEALDMSAALVSWHVKRLAQAGVVERRRIGNRVSLFLTEHAPGGDAGAADAIVATA